MHLLVVHQDAEVGEQLVKMVEDYTSHRCDCARTDDAALAWARSHARCALLLTQLDGPQLDGLSLGGSLAEMFPGLQTMFLPAYAVADQRLEIADTKVFPEPINGEQLLHAIERTAGAAPGAPDFFHALDVLQMCCLSGRSGALQLVRRHEAGIVFLKEGNIVDADTPSAHGLDALLEIGGWDAAEFAYDGSVRGGQTISLPWAEALTQAVVRSRGELPHAPAEPASAPPSNASKIPDPPPQTAPEKRTLFARLRRGGKLENAREN